MEEAPVEAPSSFVRAIFQGENGMRIVTVVVGASCLLLMALFIALFIVAHDAEADEYYKGKTVTVYVGYGPGGTNDISSLK
jgi:hypothetical protein